MHRNFVMLQNPEFHVISYVTEKFISGNQGGISYMTTLPEMLAWTFSSQGLSDGWTLAARPRFTHSPGYQHPCDGLTWLQKCFSWSLTSMYLTLHIMVDHLNFLAHVLKRTINIYSKMSTLIANNLSRVPMLGPRVIQAIADIVQYLQIMYLLISFLQ